MKDSIKSIVVISAICLVIAAALGVTNHFTKDVIEEGTAARTQEALKSLIPEAENFEELDISAFEGLPENVTAIYRDVSGIGYVFQITTKGYDSGLVIMCAVSANDGRVLKTSTLSNNETPTIGGSKVIDNNDYISSYEGKDASSINGVDTVSGATVTSKAYKAAVIDALKAFALVAVGEE